MTVRCPGSRVKIRWRAAKVAHHNTLRHSVVGYGIG